MFEKFWMSTDNAESYTATSQWIGSGRITDSFKVAQELGKDAYLRQCFLILIRVWFIRSANSVFQISM